MHTRLLVFIAIVQSILLAAYAFVCETGLAFLGIPGSSSAWTVRGVMVALSFSFVGSSVVAFRSFRTGAKALYTCAAVGLGLLSFAFFASGLCWGVEGLVRVLGGTWERRSIGVACYGLALVASLAALANAAWLRVVRVSVALPRLPEAWKGRTAAVVSDLHLGHVRGSGFLRTVIGRIAEHQPDVVFIPGDLYDGTAVDSAGLAACWAGLRPPFGIYFVTGNHEEFGDPDRFAGPLARSGVRVLQDEKVTVEGLQILGLHDSSHRDPRRFQAVLDRAGLDPSRAALLLAHSPIHLGAAERAGISLQLSGHTHGGQFLPFTWIVSWVYGRFATGLHPFGSMWVYTSCGAGTWGPPMRLGTNPELVILRFE